MNAAFRSLFLALLWLCSGLAGAGQVLVQGVSLTRMQPGVRVTFELGRRVEHRVFRLSAPERLVVDLSGARLRGRLPRPDVPLVRRIRDGLRGERDWRLVLDLKTRVKVKSYWRKGAGTQRLIVEAVPLKAAGRAHPRPTPVKQVPTRRGRDLVIVIDAGHGGRDAGAKGPHGVMEKDVTLAITRRMARLVDAAPGMRAVLTRKGDYYLGLRQRIARARKAGADLFVSIHANSYPRDRRVEGAAVYVLSHRGASSEAARWLAQTENDADLVGGVDLDSKDDVLASVLLDLSQGATMESSRRVAGYLLRNLRRVCKVHKRRIQHAGFVVLKAPDIPSVLVETAFISNPREESRLTEAHFQQRLARALFRGVRAYFREHPPAGTWMAQHSPRRHVIARGETLSTIARQYRVSLNALRHVNRLSTDLVRVGQVLTIPEG